MGQTLSEPVVEKVSHRQCIASSTPRPYAISIPGCGLLQLDCCDGFIDFTMLYGIRIWLGLLLSEIHLIAMFPRIQPLRYRSAVIK